MNFSKFILIGLLINYSSLFAQSDSVIISNDVYEQNEIIHYGNNVDSFHFRYTDASQAVDIWTNDYLHFQGKFLNFTKSIDLVPQKFYSQVITLDTSLARTIYNLFLESGILKIPTQDSIPGWRSGLDGADYIFQYSISKQYYYKKYWTPSEFKNIQEAVLINNLCSKLMTAANIRGRWARFLHLLPLGCYEYSDGLMSCNKKDSK